MMNMMITMSKDDANEANLAGLYQVMGEFRFSLSQSLITSDSLVVLFSKEVSGTDPQHVADDLGDAFESITVKYTQYRVSSDTNRVSRVRQPAVS